MIIPYYVLEPEKNKLFLNYPQKISNKKFNFKSINIFNKIIEKFF